MATANPFDLLGDDDNDDLSLLLAAQQHKAAAAATKKLAPAATAKPAKLPTKPLPPSQAGKYILSVREARNAGGRGGGGRGGGRGCGRGRGGPGAFNRDSDNSGTTFGNSNGVPYKPSDDRESGRFSERRPYPGTHEGERPRRMYDRHNGTGRGMEYKRDGAGMATGVLVQMRFLRRLDNLP